MKAGLKGVHLQAILWHALPATLSGVPGDKSDTQDNTVKYLGFNSLTNYQWVHFVSINQDYASWGEKAISKYKEFSESFSIPYFRMFLSIGIIILVSLVVHNLLYQMLHLKNLRNSYIKQKSL